ncbi:unnamed protein product [Brassica oleracea var. botrytis]|uniref:(rape) hypothetical protein n=1 Tax=Brassica napus TaxID=3708 RepID=A0A816K2Q8_BRANA|nr:unnamed protein product [Brassica napus]
MCFASRRKLCSSNSRLVIMFCWLEVMTVASRRHS